MYTRGVSDAPGSLAWQELEGGILGAGCGWRSQGTGEDAPQGRTSAHPACSSLVMPYAHSGDGGHKHSEV